ncbi:hypothetical protein [Anaeromyxobacter oryzae]|uniref:Uncharacterized protein n=1 Tax=Anaeromyxobacter oryzae TaxID=2918170 RepID=A0ABM7X2E2_9BACT|nr:hypothetical protein [Anaeromyxobacter oryzae]BDG05961.1 hypothetical protein AMOR_49570 [Anaeromyxobacter oryzae]
MTGWLPILALLAVAPPAGGEPADAVPAPPADLRLAIRPALSDVAPAALDASFLRSPERSVPPPCLADVCQPRVAVPGFDLRAPVTDKRAEPALRLLDRARLEPLAPLATAGWLLAGTGIHLDYTPPQLANPVDAARGGWGHVELLLRWRIDAWNAPVSPIGR